MNQFNDISKNLKDALEGITKSKQDLKAGLATADMPEANREFFKDAFKTIDTALTTNDETGLNKLKTKLENLAKANKE